MRPIVLAGILLCARAPDANAQAVADTTSVRVERLAGLGRVWGYAKYFHPALAYRNIDWDSALVAVLPRVRAARSATEYGAAVQALLDVLDDPLTRVLPATAAPAAPARRTAVRLEGGVLTVTAGNYYTLSDAAAHEALQAIPDALRRAQAVVLDLRSSEPTDPFGRMQLAGALEPLQRLLVIDTLDGPAERRRV